MAVALAPGLHVLENRPLGAPSPKADGSTASLERTTDAASALSALRRVLGDHTGAEPATEPAVIRRPPDGRRRRPNRGPRPTACTSTTTAPAPRASSATGRTRSLPPQIWVADGPPCRPRSSTSAGCGPGACVDPDDAFPRRQVECAAHQLAVRSAARWRCAPSRRGPARPLARPSCSAPRSAVPRVPRPTRRRARRAIDRNRCAGLRLHAAGR